MKYREKDFLKVHILENRTVMGEHAGRTASEAIKCAIAEKGEARVIFAAAPSQNEVLAYLVSDSQIDWSKVVAFHMDEYIGLAPGALQRFSQFLKTHLFDLVPLKAVHLLHGELDDCEGYSEKLKEKPIDVICLGIGENGHLAFNDPPVADFSDPVWVKVVELDQICRAQQVHDGCFLTLVDVPTHAVTLTIPALFSGGELICTVPGKAKKKAISDTLLGPISTKCPASILRTHPNCRLYVDQEGYEDVE